MLGDVRMPYIDNDVYDHLTSLPASYFLDQIFHTETIHRVFPQHADLPFQTKGQTRAGRWLFRLSSLGVEWHRLMSRSRWIKRHFLNLKTTPADVSRVLYLLQLERLVKT